jgi:DNA repair protein RadC
MQSLKEIFDVKFITGKSNTIYEIKQSPLFSYDFNTAYKVESSRSAADAIETFLHSTHSQYDVKEYAGFITLNQANRITGNYIISEGGISSTIIEVRLVALAAILSLSTNVILFHSHPSGNPQISVPDKMITKQCKEALDLFGIKLLDHIIILPNNNRTYKYTSLADEGEV